MKKIIILVAICFTIGTLSGCAGMSRSTDAQKSNCPECEYNFNNNGMLSPA